MTLKQIIASIKARRKTNLVYLPVLPDGSSFVTASLPLPKDHWLYAPRCTEWDSARDTSADTPRPIVSNEQREAVEAAVRWAVRGATMCGQEMDFDPDALVLNAAYALCGPMPFASRHDKETGITP